MLKYIKGKTESPSHLFLSQRVIKGNCLVEFVEVSPESIFVYIKVA